MNTHECTATELGLNGTDESKFWPLNKKNRITIIPEMYYCLDPDDLKIQGHFDSMEGQLIFIDIIKC